MIPGFGKQNISIGSSPQCDVVMSAPGIGPEHARIVHQGGGKLVFIPSLPNAFVQVQGPQGSITQPRPLAPGEQIPFDFRTAFSIANLTVPLSHPSVVMMIMAVGQAPSPRGQIILGRDPTRASIVLQHPSVSSQHATVLLDRMMVNDHGSTSGTFVGQARTKIGPNTPTPIDPNGIIAFGPVPIPVSLLAQLAQAATSGPVASANLETAAFLQGQGQPQQMQQQQMQQQQMQQQQMQPHPSMQQQVQPHPSMQQQMPQQMQQQMQPAGPAMQGGAGGFGKATAAMSFQQAQQLVSGMPSAQAAAGASPPAGMPAKKNKTILGQLDFTAGQKPVRTIGRTPDNDIVISHPQVSSRHALLHQIAGQLFIEDRGSGNGTYVRGQRVPNGQKIAVQSGEKIYVGPMPLQIEISATGAAEVVQEDYALERWAGKPLYEIEAWSLQMQVPDRDNRGEMKTLLDNVSFKALPGDMIALMGPSGAGKTTLLLTLNGYLPPTSGVVRINGEDLYSIYDTLRGSIGYVPQDDLVHPELTVFEAVRYSAKFRLPPDYTDDEIEQRVQQTLKDLGLDGVSNLQIGKPEKKTLSGGQRKRVNIALELVTDPVILFLDEPTSGLAADDTTALIELLANLTKATGKTIIMTIHQPAKDEFEKFTHCLVMGYGGIPMFFGPTQPDAYKFFGSIQKGKELDNPRDMFDMLAMRERPIFERMKQQNPNASRQEARKVAAMEWRTEFFDNQHPTFKRMYSGRREVGTGDSRGVPPGRSATSGQLGLLLSRYFKCKVRDTGGIAIMFLQAPIIGGLFWLVFGSQEDAVPGWCLGALQELSKRGTKDGTQIEAGAEVLKNMTTTADYTAAVFFLVVAAVWFGTSNAAREIVSERSIYMRERMVNLGLLNYVFSKFILLSFFCIVQCTLLLAIVFFGLGLPGGMPVFGQMLGALVATSIVATALGLLLSTAVSTSEAAMALTPIALIPQVILGGLIVPMTAVPSLKPIFYAVPARWGFESAVVPNRLALEGEPAWTIDLNMKEPASSPGDFVNNGQFECATAQVAAENLKSSWGFENYETVWIPYAVLGGMMALLMIVLCVLLKRRDPV